MINPNEWFEKFVIPNVTERLHEILANERSAAMPRWDGQFKSAAAAFANRPAASCRTSTTAARVSCITARTTAASRAWATSIGTASAVLQIEETFFRVEGGGGWIVVALIVESVHLVDVLMIVGCLVAVCVHHTVTRRTESQSNNAILVGYR